LESILAASEEHEAMQQRSLEVWESQYSTSAVAAMIRRVVESRAGARSA
jgi:hypothetical protein